MDLFLGFRKEKGQRKGKLKKNAPTEKGEKEKKKKKKKKRKDSLNEPQLFLAVNNLGIVFGPVLMRSQNSNPKQIMDEAPSVVRIACSFIDNYDYFFLDGPLKLGLYDQRFLSFFFPFLFFS